jgi:phage-related protein
MARQIKRYSVTGYGQRFEDKNGRFVMYEDVAPYIKEDDLQQGSKPAGIAQTTEQSTLCMCRVPHPVIKSFCDDCGRELLSAE